MLLDILSKNREYIAAENTVCFIEALVYYVFSVCQVILMRRALESLDKRFNKEWKAYIIYTLLISIATLVLPWCLAEIARDIGVNKYIICDNVAIIKYLLISLIASIGYLINWIYSILRHFKT